MVEILKRVDPCKKRLLLECDCGSVVVFDESDIECPEIQERYWHFSCPVCKRKYWHVEKVRLMNYFKTITEQQAEELLKGGN